MYSFAELNDEFYCGTWPEARVYRRPTDGIGDWVDCGRLGEEKEVMGMITCEYKIAHSHATYTLRCFLPAIFVDFT